MLQDFLEISKENTFYSMYVWVVRTSDVLSVMLCLGLR